MTTSRSRRIWIAIAGVVGALVMVNLVAQGLDRAVGGNEPGGPSGSSYATAPTGLAAFAALVAHYGHEVRQIRGPIADRPPAPDATAFVLEPNELTADDSAALVQFVTSGGRLIVGGKVPFYLRNLRDRPPVWQSAGDASWTLVDPALGPVHDIEAEGVGAWSATGSGRALVGSSDHALLTHERVGAGEMFFLADASPLENGFLGTGDNAAFGLALAGEAARPVVFPEGAHGYGRSRGLSAIPDRWKIALLLVAIAALAFVWSRARRFGPPDRTARDLPPARAEYVEALSISLERTHDRVGSFVPAQRWARTRVVSRAGLDADPNAGDDEVVRAARSLGCTDAEIAALGAPVSDDASVMALGRLISRIGGNGRIS